MVNKSGNKGTVITVIIRMRDIGSPLCEDRNDPVGGEATDGRGSDGRNEVRRKGSRDHVWGCL